MGRLRMVFRLMVRIPGLKGGFFPARCRTRRRRSSAALPFPSSYACFLRMSSRVSFPRLRPENLAGCSTGLRLPGFQSGFHLIQVLFTVLRSEEPEPPPRHLDIGHHVRRQLLELPVNRLRRRDRQLRGGSGRYLQEKGKKGIVDEIQIQGRGKHPALLPPAGAGQSQLIPESQGRKRRRYCPPPPYVDGKIMVIQP